MEDNVMGVREAWAALWASNLQRKEGPVIAYSNIGVDQAPKDSYHDLAKDGYQENAIVYRCVNEISKGAASVPFKLFRGEQPIEDHPLLDLLARPNPMNSGSEYFQTLYSYVLLSGNSFLLKAGPENREPDELYLLRPDRVKIKPSKRDIPLMYEYTINGRVAAEYPVDQSTGLSDVKQIKTFNPLDDYYGLSPIKPAAADIDQHNLSGRHNVQLLMNGARPSGAVVYKPKDEQGVMTMLTDSQREQLRSDLLNRFETVDNTGRTMILEGDFDYKEMGLTPKDMDFAMLKNFAARDIALCFGVPSQLVGIPDSQTYSNMAEARLALYEETIIPLLHHIESDLNEWLVPMFSDDIVLKYDIDSIPAVTERRRMIYENILRAVNEGVLTRNEARERIGLDPITGGDEVYIPANLFPLGEPAPEPSSPKSAEEAEELGREAYGEDKTMELHLTQEEAEKRAEQLGCEGSHKHEINGVTYYMPCKSHEDYHSLMGTEESKEYQDLLPEEEIKAIDLKPTRGMAAEAERALEWRKEFNRGGTNIGVTRANQLVNRENLSESTVMRMYSFFSRHEVDKRAEGFRAGEDGYPSAGRIAWGLWGGDSGFTWSTAKRNQIMKAREKRFEIDPTVKKKSNGSTHITKEGISGSQPY
jgi:HK97 family phage portal protein